MNLPSSAGVPKQTYKYLTLVQLRSEFIMQHETKLRENCLYGFQEENGHKVKLTTMEEVLRKTSAYQQFDFRVIL